MLYFFRHKGFLLCFFFLIPEQTLRFTLKGVRYPSVEQNNNSENYQKALEKPNAKDAVNYAYTKLFWAK